MFNKIGELLLLPLVLYYLKGLKNDKFGFANLSFNQFNSRNRDSTMFSLFIVSICPICISVLRQQDVTSAKIDSKSTSYMRSDGQHAPLYAQTLQTMYKTYPWHIGTCTYLLVQFVFSGTFIPTRYIPVHIELKQQITVTVGTSTTTQITSCLRSDGQHAPRTHKHCRPCVMHAHDTGVRAHTCLHGLL